MKQSKPGIEVKPEPPRRRATDQAALLLANLDDIAEDLEAGAIVAIRDDRLRIRPLPIHRDKRD